MFGAVYNGVTGYFSDIMSYSRLMALMLSGSIIASVFNQLGAGHRQCDRLCHHLRAVAMR